MKTKIFLAMIVAVLVIGLTSLVAAEDYTFGLTEVYSFSEKTPNWSIEISVPQLSGMADEDAQADVNSHFFMKKDEMVADYQKNVAFAEQSLAEGNEPHFMYQYTWDVVTDNDDYFVFRTSWFMAAGSSTTLNEYWNLDKKTGSLLDFDADAVTSPEEMVTIREQIYAEMLRANEAGEGVFWTEDDAFDAALGQVRYLNHWYYNQDGDLVITFDKYEIAPGVMGSPEFTVDPKASVSRH